MQIDIVNFNISLENNHMIMSNEESVKKQNKKKNKSWALSGDKSQGVKQLQQLKQWKRRSSDQSILFWAFSHQAVTFVKKKKIFFFFFLTKVIAWWPKARNKILWSEECRFHCFNYVYTWSCFIYILTATMSNLMELTLSIVPNNFACASLH